jgi:hypothetical protein
MDGHGTPLREQDPIPAPAVGGVSRAEAAGRAYTIRPYGLEAYREVAALLLRHLSTREGQLSSPYPVR